MLANSVLPICSHIEDLLVVCLALHTLLLQGNMPLVGSAHTRVCTHIHKLFCPFQKVCCPTWKEVVLATANNIFMTIFFLLHDLTCFSRCVNLKLDNKFTSYTTSKVFSKLDNWKHKTCFSPVFFFCEEINLTF